ncbi:hypothetical protein, partial [Burkholderia thailandensis]
HQAIRCRFMLLLQETAPSAASMPEPAARHGRHRCTCRLDDRFDCRVGGPVAPSRYRLRNPIDEFADCDRPHALECSSMTPIGEDDINQSPRVTLFHKSAQQDFI